jgi:hypothetical protein
MRTRPAPTIVFLLALGAACSQFDVRVERDPAADFGGFRSWAWLPVNLQAPMDQQLPDRYFERKLVEAVDRVLGAKGYVESADGAAPDFFINYRLLQQVTTDLQIEPGYGIGWWGVTRDTYDAGTLVLDVVDARKSALVFRGTAAARLVPQASLERRAKRVEEAVEQILATFPPRAGT